MNGLFYFKLTMITYDGTNIALLAAHSAIERSLFYNDRTSLSIGQRLYDLILGSQNGDLGIMNQTVISNEFAGDSCWDGLIYGYISAHVVADFPCFTSFLSLLFHRSLETILVNGKVLIFQDLQC